MDFDLVPESEEPDATAVPPAPPAPTSQDPQPPTQAQPPLQMTLVTEAEEGQTIPPAIGQDSHNDVNASITRGSSHYQIPR